MALLQVVGKLVIRRILGQIAFLWQSRCFTRKKVTPSDLQAGTNRV
jgi:hypothetical protein